MGRGSQYDPYLNQSCGDFVCDQTGRSLGVHPDLSDSYAKAKNLRQHAITRRWGSAYGMPDTNAHHKEATPMGMPYPSAAETILDPLANLPATHPEIIETEPVAEIESAAEAVEPAEGK